MGMHSCLLGLSTAPNLMPYPNACTMSCRASVPRSSAEPLDDSTIQALVDERCKARASRDFSAADVLKARLEAHGVILQDEVGGGTRWALASLRKDHSPNVVNDLSKQALRHMLHSQPGNEMDDVAQVARLTAAASTICCSMTEPGPRLLGRSAADAAFAFALAGSTDAMLMDALAEQQAREFARWGSAQPLTMLQTCEKLAAAGVRPSHSVFREGARILRKFGALEARPEERRRTLEAAARVERCRFGQVRPTVWLWRRASRMAKVAPPTPDESSAAVHACVARFDDPELPLVLDLGCGFGTSCLALVESTASCDALSRLRSYALASDRSSRCQHKRLDGFNVLGCDASPLKCSFARGVATRWDRAGTAQFACASALSTISLVRDTYEGELVGVLLQFPSPYRAGDSAGNTQLPGAADDSGYMINSALVEAVHEALSPGGSFLLVQSNVEDVATHARATAEAAGFSALAECEVDLSSKLHSDAHDVEADLEVNTSRGDDKVQACSSKVVPDTRRRTRMEQALGRELPHATGLGWWRSNPLGEHALSETEAMLALQRRAVYRCLFVPRATTSKDC